MTTGGLRSLSGLSEVGHHGDEYVVDRGRVGRVVSVGTGFAGDAAEHGLALPVVLVRGVAVGDAEYSYRLLGGADLVDQLVDGQGATAAFVASIGQHDDCVDRVWVPVGSDSGDAGSDRVVKRG